MADSKMTLEDNNDRIIEGVSNEVISALGMIVLLLLPLINFLWRNRDHALQQIHPAQQRLVDEIRRRLGVVERDPEEDAGRPEGPVEEDGEQPRLEPSAPPMPERVYNGDRICPICYGESRLAILTNCGHLFCGGCIVAYWKYGNWVTSPVACPVCRSTVSVFLPSFSEADPDEPNRDNILAEARDYNRRFSGAPRPWLDYIWDIPVLVPHLLRRLMSLEGIVWVFRARIYMCLAALVLYVLSPLDILPEAVFGLLGFLDDLFVVFLIAVYLVVAYRNYMAREGQ